MESKKKKNFLSKKNYFLALPFLFVLSHQQIKSHLYKQSIWKKEKNNKYMVGEVVWKLKPIFEFEVFFVYFHMITKSFALDFTSY